MDFPFIMHLKLYSFFLALANFSLNPFRICSFYKHRVLIYFFLGDIPESSFGLSHPTILTGGIMSVCCSLSLITHFICRNKQKVFLNILLRKAVLLLCYKFFKSSRGRVNADYKEEAGIFSLKIWCITQGHGGR